MKNSTHVQLVNVLQSAQLILGNCFGLLLFTGLFFFFLNKHESHVHTQFPKHFQFPVFASCFTLRDVIISESWKFVFKASFSHLGKEIHHTKSHLMNRLSWKKKEILTLINTFCSFLVCLHHKARDFFFFT